MEALLIFLFLYVVVRGIIAALQMAFFPESSSLTDAIGKKLAELGK